MEATLDTDEGWDEAVAGCGAVFHTASPFPIGAPKHEDELIRPAVDGTTRVLKVVSRAGGTVKRVVVTSSCASVAWGQPPKVVKEKTFTEEDWSDVSPGSSIDAYSKSKTLAERAAWDFVAALPEDQRFELATVNPSYVLGPVLNPNGASSYELLTRLMNRKDPGAADVRLIVVDVRDVADGHLAAMTAPEAAGGRHILSAASVSMITVARALADEFNDKGYNVATKKIPYALMWVLGRCDKTIRAVLPEVGVDRKMDHSRAERVLGIDFIAPETTVVDMAYSMIEKGALPNKLPDGFVRNSAAGADAAGSDE